MNNNFLKQRENNFLIRKIKNENTISTGNINSTYKIESEGANYVLQRINKYVFKKPEQVMQNICNVSRFLERKVLQEGGNPKREVLHPIDTLDGTSYFLDENGEYWRMYDLIEGAKTFDIVDNPETFKKVGKAFGKFQNRLIDYNAQNLHEAIPDFHNTPKRIDDLKRAVVSDRVGRLQEIKGKSNHPLKQAIDYILSKEEELKVIEEGKKSGKIPLRVTHNDTKINNVMIDEETGEPICVIDLDTIGPDSSLVDFGDAIRSGANPAGEEPKKIDSGKIDLELYKAYTEGYLSETLVIDEKGKLNKDKQKGLTEEEVKLLHKAPEIITLEQASRFIEDYLNGDVYFKIKSNQPNDVNLRRGLTQIYLAQDMAKKSKEMEKIVQEIVDEKIKNKSEEER